MTIAIIFLAAVILVAVLCPQGGSAQRMRLYYNRRCKGRKWRASFPDARKEDIRGFLGIFVSSFALDEKKTLSFDPSDRVMDVYRAINPQVGGMDSLECETLVAECERHYGIDITVGFCESTTLGDIFHATRKSA